MSSRGRATRDEGRARARQAREEAGWTTARRAEALRLKRQGMTLRQIGDILEVSDERARRLIARAERTEREELAARGRQHPT